MFIIRRVRFGCMNIVSICIPFHRDREFAACKGGVSEFLLPILFKSVFAYKSLASTISFISPKQSGPEHSRTESYSEFDTFFWPRKVPLHDEPIDKFVEVKFCNGQYWPSTMDGASSMTN